MSESKDSPFRILAVDDEKIVLSFVTDALEEEDCEVVTASNSDEALRQASSGSFDLILSDIRMPGMDGLELVSRVKEYIPDIAVIYMTGYANLNSAKDAIKQGAIDYIMKPFELVEIRQSVRNAIQKKLEAAEQSPDHQLKGLTDLNKMLFRVGDRKALIVSSLKFAMMHQHADRGSVLYHDASKERFLLVSILGDVTEETILPDDPLISSLNSTDDNQWCEPTVVTDMKDHPIFRMRSEPQLRPYLCPDWIEEERAMVAVPVRRAEKLCGIIMLGFDSETFKLSATTMQFLTIAASQLAITLENLSLLEESQKAYARLKELQDETIELETMAARGQTSAEIGHELNNFLGVIAASISLLDVNLKKKKYDVLDRYVTTVTESVEKIKAFTANLMDLRPVSSAKEIIRFDIAFKDVIEYLIPQRRFEGVHIEVLKITDNILFEANMTQIQQLLYNIFNNAADATKEKGNGHIKVAAEANPESDEFTVTVSDNGVGIEPQMLERAFNERFTTKRTGHGFGLVVCKRIIEHHNGKLSMDSIPGVGTTITIRFPVAEECVDQVPELV